MQVTTTQGRPTFHLREYRRFPIQCIAYFTTDTGTGTGAIWNCSRGGVRLDSETPLAYGTVLKLFLMLPEVQHGIVVKEAVVCWSRGHEVGLAIRGIDPQEADRLQDFITACV
jgi:hypothetical protein